MIKKLAAASAVIIFAVSFASAQSDWAAFWHKFKVAVAENDKKTILSLSREKLSDSDYKELFGAPARRKCFARAKPVRDADSYSVFCGEQGYLFQKIGGRFKFAESFAND